MRKLLLTLFIISLLAYPSQSARLFDDAASQYLERASAVVTVVPFTISSWFNLDTDAVNSELICIAASGTAENFFRMAMTDTPDNKLQIVAKRAGAAWAATTNSWTVDVWSHALGIWASATDRTVVLNGDWANKGISTVSKVPQGLDRLTIAAFHNADFALIQFLSGRLAEIGIWDVALTQAEGESLAAGFSPLFIRPQSLVAYYRLIRTDNDIVGGNNMTPYNTPTIGNHPRVIYPSVMWTPTPSVPPPPTGQVITIIMTSIPLFLIPFFFIKRRKLRR